MTFAVMLLAGGLLVLAVGLVLLGSAGPSAATASRVEHASQGRRRDTAPDASDRRPTAPSSHEGTCDWTAWLEDDRGERTLLRAAEGDPCCSYAFRVRDLDPVLEPIDDMEDALTWSGTETRISAEGAATPLHRDLVTRRLVATSGGMLAALSLDRSGGPEIRTAGWREQDPADLDAAVPNGTRSEQLWAIHIDDLRAHGAHPAATDGPRVRPLNHRRRIALDVHVSRGCDVGSPKAHVVAEARARLGATSSSPLVHLAAPLLASWVEVDGRLVRADVPTVPHAGVAAWAPTVDDDAAGVQVTCDTAAGITEGEWAGRHEADIDETRAAVVVGSSVWLEAEASPDGPLGAEVHAEARGHVVLRLGPAADDTGARPDGTCPRCVPEVEVVLGAADVPGARGGAPGSTPGCVIRLDGRAARLEAPAPGGGARSWHLATQSVGAATLARVTEVI